MCSSIKQLIKAGFNLVGFNVVKNKNSPSLTLLGLKSMSIRTVIDVGANSGQFAKKIRLFFPDSKIYCFEPLPQSFSELSEWAKTQENRVLPFNLAIGEKTCEVEMFVHEEHNTSSSLMATTKQNEQYYPFTKNQKRIVVRQTTLDEALDEVKADLSSEMLIKLDVQGYEAHVIAGGNKIFSKASACIVEVCLDGLYEGQAGFNELLMMLKELGFRYVGNLDQVYGEDGHCVFLDAVFLRDNQRVHNK